MALLPTFRGYTVDYRQKQFRFIHPGNCVCGGGEIEFIDFDSDRGHALLLELSREEGAQGSRLKIRKTL